MQVFLQSKLCFLALVSFLLVSACSQTDTDQEDTNLKAKNSVESTKPQKQLVILNSGDLQYLNKLLIQQERATRAHKQNAAQWLQASRKMAVEDSASGYAEGYDGLPKMHCPSAMTYPTNEALIICTESILLTDIKFEGRLNRFRGVSGMYQTALALSEAVGEPLTPEQRQSVESNINCLNLFLANAVTPSPTCQLVFTTLR